MTLGLDQVGSSKQKEGEGVVSDCERTLQQGNRRWAMGIENRNHIEVNRTERFGFYGFEMFLV